MAVNVKIPVYLQHLTDRTEMTEVGGETVGRCLKQLVEQFPRLGKELFDKNGNLLPYVDIYVNGESAYPDEMVKPVNNGDELYVTYIIEGG